MKVSKLGEGQNSISLLINDEFVFRFPRHQDALLDLRNETSITQRIAKFVPFAVPVAQWKRLEVNADIPFVGHRAIPGVPLSATAGRVDSAREKLLSAVIGRFAIALHAVPLDVLDGAEPRVRDRPEDWLSWMREVEALLLPSLPVGVARRVAAEVGGIVDSLVRLKFEPTLRHGNFGEGNTLVNDACSHVTGVIDFGSAAIGDPAVDIAGIMSSSKIGKHVIAYLKGHYAGIVDLIPRAELYMRTFPIDEALLGTKGRDPEAIERGVARFQ